MTNLVAIPGLQTGMAGIIVFWRLSGPIARPALAAAWAEAGLCEDDLPAPVSVEVAARRAVKAQKGPGRLISKGKEADAPWVLAVDGVTRNEEVVHSITCRVWVSEWIRVEPSNHPWADEIVSTFEQGLEQLQPGDISTWLVRRAEAHDAVGLRDTGGFYFIPPARVPAWRLLASAVNATTGHKVYEIPAMESDQAVDAVFDAITSEATAFAAKMEEELKEGNLGERAVESRKSRCADTIAKIGRYEALLGRKLDGLRGAVQAVEAELVAGMLSAMPDPEDAGAAG